VPTVLEAVRARRATDPDGERLMKVEERLLRMTAVDLSAEPVAAA
jgi:hypothetical protein